jgi:superfamily II DNA or RNA helicase
VFALREYQSSAIERIRELFREGKRRILLVSMMGSGKTATASHMIAGAVEKGKDVLFIAHRREILFQTREKLEAAGIEHGWIMSGMRKSAMAPVHLASIQTLTRREYPNVGLVILDEAHHCPSASYRKVMEHYQGVPQIGLTATPCRADGNGLGGLFDGMVQAAYPSELIKQGYLVPARIFAPSMPDLRGVKIKRGDYDEKQLGEAVDKPKLVGDVVSHWEQHAQGRKTIVFAVTRAHAQHLVENFQNCGHRALYVDGETNHYQRKEIFGEFGTQRNGVLVNVGITTEGYDNPAVSCIVLARPTKSLGLYLQMSGRGLRPAEGKKELLILDHSGASLTHGYPDEDIVWNLDPTQPAGTKKPKEKDKRESKPWVCGYCFCVNHDSVDPHCVSCGQKAVKAAHSPEVRKADLQELQRKTKAHTSTADREKEWVKFVFICSNSNRKIGAAYHMYKQKFGCNPHHGFQYSPRGAVEWNMPAREFIDRWKSKHRHEDREAELERQAIMEEGHIT